MKVRFLACRWNEVSRHGLFAVELDHLSKVLREVHNGQNAPCVIQVETKSDTMAAVVCSDKIDGAQAQKIYDHFKRCSDNTSPFNETRVYEA